MPSRKNQHYVPQHYLRGWSTNERIEVFHLNHGDLPDTSISDVCSVDYLYGNPTHVEKELSVLEGLQNNPLERLRSGSTLEDLSRSGLILLLSFIATQRTRSKFTQEDIAAGDEILRSGVQEDLANNRYQDRIEWTSDLTDQEKEDTLVEAWVLGIHQRHMLLGIFSHYAIQDLQAVMLRNATDRDFIVSDTPIVLDNPRFKREIEMGGAGLTERGLQIFCPIDPSRVLLLYDPAVYSIDSNSYRQVIIKSPSVANEVNLLQFHNAGSVVMHSDCDTSYLDELASGKEDVRVRRTHSREYNVDNLEPVEIETTPPYQVPGISPSIPGQTMFHEVPYANTRPTAQKSRTQEVTERILEEVDGHGDVGLILGIRHLAEWLSDK